jgi:hypothetical protein
MAANPTFEQTPAKYLKTLSIIHFALVAGQMLFAIVALVQSKKIMINVRNPRDPLIFIVPLIAAGGFVASNVLFKKKVNEIGKTASLKIKLIDYQTALIIRFAALEGPSLLGIVAFLITGQLFFLVISGAIILYFIHIRPTKQSIEETLELNYQELGTFSQPDKVL